MKFSGLNFAVKARAVRGRTLPDLFAAAALGICAAFLLPIHDSLFPNGQPLQQACFLQLTRISLVFAALYFTLHAAVPLTTRWRASSRAMGSRMIAPLRWALEAARGVRQASIALALIGFALATGLNLLFVLTTIPLWVSAVLLAEALLAIALGLSALLSEWRRSGGGSPTDGGPIVFLMLAGPSVPVAALLAMTLLERRTGIIATYIGPVCTSGI